MIGIHEAETYSNIYQLPTKPEHCQILTKLLLDFSPNLCLNGQDKIKKDGRLFP